MNSLNSRNIAAAGLLALLLTTSSNAAEELSFNRDIRPILSAHCFQCHGPDAAHREADMRFDTEDGVRHAFEGGLAKSEAWERITTDDSDIIMPPPDAHNELSAEKISLLRRWIEQGAAWQGHWAFIPPTRPDVPEVPEKARLQNPIDAFVLNRLQSIGLQQSPAADKEQLLRRVTFDLTGLPPTIDEIDAFLADESPNAYEKVVDRLLASPHYGERMTLMWMDAARYGDTSVFHADGPRDMWPWRDWVIDAYNSNKPFDQFTVEQLAGDLLPDATLKQKIATGFLRNNPSTDEGGVIAEEFRVEYAVDRVKTTSMIWLGLSLECAQCHSHKYDPISQEEYYQVFAYFNQAADPGMQSRRGNQAPVVDVFDEARLAQAEELKPKQKQLEAELAEYAKRENPEFDRWLAELSAEGKGKTLLPQDMTLHVPLGDPPGEGNVIAAAIGEAGKLSGPAEFKTDGDRLAFRGTGGNYIDFPSVGNFEKGESFSFGAWIKPDGKGSNAFLARMNPGNAHRGYDLYCNGNGIAVHIINSWPNNALKVNTKAKLKPNAWQHVFATYDGSGKASGIKIYFDGKPQEWTIEQDGLTGSIQTKVPFTIGRRSGNGGYKGLIDDVRVFNRLLTEDEVAAIAGNSGIDDLISKPAADLTEDDRKRIRDYYLRNHDERYRALTAEVTSIKGKIAEYTKPVVNVMVMQDVPKMRSTFVLDRGSYASPLKDRAVQPGVPRVLPALPEGADANRLGLAKWLVDAEHPLTARVTVNRYWSLFFGEGLVGTLGDFGSQGDWPTHPALLDWLAVDFIESGWDVKRMLKQIVMSATYRQSSRVTQQHLKTDPENKWLARAPRFRLQGEFIRDNALASSGLLVTKVGGPGVKPYQPPGLWNEVSLSGNVRFKQDAGEKLYRRSMYTYWKRSAPAPALTTFDTPTREACTLERSRTNTPLQALVTLNDVQFVEASRHLAERVMTSDAKSVDDQIRMAYRLAAGTTPSDAVMKVLQAAYDEEFAAFQSQPEQAKMLLAVGDSARNETLDASRHAAMTIVASLILNLDAVLMRG